MPEREAGGKGVGMEKQMHREYRQPFYTCQASFYPSFKEVIKNPFLNKTFDTEFLVQPHLPRTLNKGKIKGEHTNIDYTLSKCQVIYLCHSSINNHLSPLY